MRIIIYGAGKFGKIIHKAIINSNTLKLAGWVDEKYDNLEKFDLEVRSPQDLHSMAFDIIVIAIINESLARSIAQSIARQGIDINKIDYIKKSIIDDTDLPSWFIDN